MKTKSVFSSGQQIYGFALRSASRTLYRVKNIDCSYIIFNNNIDHYLSMLLHDQPAYILGMGLYSGVAQDKILIEKMYPPFLKQTRLGENESKIKHADNALISLRILEAIKNGQLNAKYSFLHIPNTLKSWVASKKIDEMSMRFKSSIVHSR